MGFNELPGLEVILYYVSIRYFMNSLPINSFPRSYIISIGLGYIESHKVSTKFAIGIYILSSYLVISNHPVTGSIIGTAFRCKFSFLPFIIME